MQPTRTTSHSKTLISNTITNVILTDLLSGNLTATISDHLPQFLIVPNIDYSTEIFLNNINDLSDNFAHFKKINKYKLKYKSKPWITPSLQKSISVKNKFLSDFIKKNDSTIKSERHLKYKNHRNLISTLSKRSKQNYCKKYFESNLNNSKSTWKGIKFIITMKNVISTVPRTLSHDENTITNPCEIANVFNNYFVSVADTAK